MKKSIFVVSTVLAAVSGFSGPAASHPRVAVLTHPDPKFEGNIYEYPLGKIGAEQAVYTTDQINDLVGKLGDYDLIMLGLLANANLLTPHEDALRKWVKVGGAICIFDACDGSIFSDFCRSLLSEGDKASTIECQGCVGWENPTKYGFVCDTDPVHPLRSLPRRVRYECRQWHCLRTSPDWTVVTTCSGPTEKHPVVAVRRYGRGFVYVAAMQQRWSSVAADLCAYQACCRLGLEPIAYHAPLARPGKETLELRFKPFDGVTAVTAELTVTDAKGTPRKTVKQFKPSAKRPNEITLVMPVAFTGRGAAGLKLTLKTALGERTVIDEKLTVPEAVAVSGPLYRNRIPAARRTDAISVRVEAYPDAGRSRGDKALVKLVDPKGQVAAKAVVPFPEDFSQNEVLVKLPLPAAKKLEVSDRWSLQAVVAAGGREYKAESKVTVVGTEHPGEVTADDDLTLIADGKPFFPLVLYHIRPDYYRDAAEMGFDTVQTFQWFSRQCESFRAAQELGLKVFFENNEKTTGGFNYMPAKFGAEPSMFAWYLPDEPLHEVNTAFVDDVAKILALDVYHPMIAVDFNSPRFEANAARCDVFAPDCYVVKAGQPPERQPYGRVVDSMDAAWAAVRKRKPVMHVLDAFGHETETDYMMTAFLSIVRDARGLMWYAYDENDNSTGVRHHDDSRQALASTLKKVKAVVPYLVNPVRRPFEVNAKTGTIYGLVCGTADCAMIVVNPTAQAAAMPTVPEMGRAKTTDLFGAPEQGAADKLDPFSVRVVTWKGAGPKSSARRNLR